MMCEPGLGQAGRTAKAVTELPLFVAETCALPSVWTPEQAGTDGRSPSSERELIERAIRDPRALAALYRQHAEAIAGYVIRRVGDVHTAEDLVADVFLTVVRSLRRYRYRGVPFRAWLYRIATNRVNRWARYERKRWSRQAMGEVGAVAADDGQPAADHDAAVARRAMLSLPVRYQTVLALHYLEGLGVQDVAAVTGCRIGTVKSRLSRARQALRDRLTRGR